MRTTITLDPDVEMLVTRAMRETDRGFKVVVNDALRRALAPAEAEQPAELPVYDMGKPLMDISCTGRVLAELDYEQYAEQTRAAE